MIPFEVSLTRHAEQARDALPNVEREKIRRGLERIAESPFTNRLLRGGKKLRRVRRYVANPWRIFYTVDKKARLVTVVSIERRETTTYR